MSNNNQIQKSSPQQLTAKQLEILNFSKDVISGSGSLAVVESKVSVSQAIESPTLRGTFKNHPEIAFGIVNILVKRFLESFAFSVKLSEIQIETLTVDFLEKFSYESLYDIILFLKMARRGEFGAAKHSIDSNLIFGEWYPKYLELKAISREQIYQKEKQSSANQPNAVSEYYLKMKQKKAQEKKRRDMIAEIDSMVSEMDRQMLEDTILDWSTKEEMLPYLDYLKSKRLTIKK